MEVSAEVHFAQKLAANEKKIRDRAIKRLNKYLSVRSTHGGLSDDDLLKIWKGLFYCMWMQDKPLIQEELSKRITNLIHCFTNTVDSLRFVKVFFETNAREWNGIDKLRLDKFLMMVRDMLHETFSLLSKDDWPLDQCIAFAKILAKHVMQPDQFRLPDGLKLHLSDIFVEEIVKVSLEKMTSKKLMVLLEPFLYFILNSNKIELVKRIMLDVVYRSVNRFNGKLPRPALWEQKMYKRKKKEKKQKAGEGEKAAEEVVVPQQEEEKANEAGEMEVAEIHNSFVLDKRLLLLLLFKQAERKTIKAPNRAAVYKFMKKYPEEWGLINNVINNNQPSEGSKVESLSNYTSDLNELEAILLEFEGKAGEQQKAKKRKKKKKTITECKFGDSEDIVDGHPHSLIGRLEAKHLGDSDANVLANKLTDQPEAKSKKKKESSVNTYKQSKLTISSNDSVKCDTENQSAVQSGSEPSRKKSKKICETVLDNGHLVSEPAALVGESPTAVAQKIRKKRKRRSSELSVDEPLPAKKQKMYSANDASQTSIVFKEAAETLEAQQASDTQPSVDTNSNARSSSSSQSPKKQPASSVELVMYSSSRSDKPPATIIALDKIHGSPPRRVSSGSPSKDPVKPAVGSSSPPKPKKTSSKKQGPGSSPAKELTKAALLTPAGSPAKKKCAVSADNCSDPGPSRVYKDVKPSSTPVASFTPAAKKKVVFNLRKNRANKFQDYLMSLANQPDPPYEPTRSPSFGILKSPNVQQETILSEDSDMDTSHLSMSQVINSAMKQSAEKKKKN